MNKNLSETFDFLRFPLAVLVVFLHISPVISTFDTHYYYSNYEKAYLFLNMGINKISNCAVPIFFFISGYLIVANINHLTLKIYFRKLKSRFWTLFVPYVLWNVLALGYLFITKQLENSITFSYIFIKPANFPLWFIRDLMCLVISFPLFYYGYKFLGKYLALLILGSFLLYVGPSMETRFILIPIFFWGFGMYCGMRRYELDSIDNYIKLSICFIALILLFLELIFNGQIAMILDNTFLVFGSFAIIILGHYIVKYTSFRFTEILTASSFFIFCCHKLGPTYIAKSGIRFITMDPVQEQIIVFLICPFISVLICILIYRFGKKSFPQLLNILTGGK